MNRENIFPFFTGILFICMGCMLFLVVSCSVLSNKQSSTMSDKQQVLNIIKEYYMGITNRDTRLFYMNSTKDFILYEQGKEMDNATFSELIMDLDQQIKIDYEFNDLKMHLTQDVAHVFYKTIGSITRNEEVEKRHYLESAFLIKEKSNWKIKFIHSTKVN